jgi:GxxExxY protein
MNELTGLVIESAIKIHTAIGPGCFERVYEEMLYYELQKALNTERLLLMPIQYEELIIRDAYKVDLLVERKLLLK